MQRTMRVRLAIAPDPQLSQGVLRTHGNCSAKWSKGQVSASRNAWPVPLTAELSIELHTSDNDTSTVASHGRSCFPSLYLFFGHEGEQALRLSVCGTCKGHTSRRELLRERLVHGLIRPVDRKGFLVHNVVIAGPLWQPDRSSRSWESRPGFGTSQPCPD